MPATRILGNRLHMTRLTVAETPEQEFSVRGKSVITESDDEGLIFYNDVTKVHVLPDEQRFTIQVVTPDLEVEMDFPNADSVREALALFESKKVAAVSAEAPGCVRIRPVESGAISGDSAAEELVDAVQPSGEPDIRPAREKMPEQIPARPDQRPSENLPDTQTHR
jgi:hypothetical protein